MATRKIPRNPEQRWEWIKYALRVNGSSLSALAKEHDNVTRQAAQLTKYFHSPKWEAIIAEKLGRKPEQIWPERYAA